MLALMYGLPYMSAVNRTCNSRGKVRIEGKDYVMANGGVVEFRFNV